MAQHKYPEVRKQEIIERAYELFVEYGVDKTSVTQIAKSVGVAKGLLYYYFKSKDEILEAVVDALCQKQMHKLRDRLDTPGYDLYDKILVVLDSYYEIHPYLETHRSDLLAEDAYLMSSFHKRYLVVAESVLDTIIEQGQHLGLFQMKHPKLMFVVTLEGTYGLMKVHTISKKEITDIFEQSLGLQTNSLYERSDVLLTHFV